MKQLVWLLGLSLLPVPAPAATLGAIDFSPCTLASRGGNAPVNAQCGHLEVPENRAAPGGRRISLAIAWVSPDAGDAEADPVFLLAGGPGQSARESYPEAAGAFDDVLKHRNVILLDQRGTGESNPLACQSDPDESEAFDPSPEEAANQTRACLETLSKTADVRHYTTTDAVADLDEVRRAIGAEQINLVGISYGTRVAQQYLKAHPDAVRTVVLDGVVPNDLVLGQEHARNLETALDTQFQRCRELPACSSAFGDPRAQLATLAETLRETPVTVRYRDALTGEVKSGEFGYPMLAALLRMYAYQPLIAATLPLLIDELSRGEADAAMAQARMLLSSLDESMAQGMGLSVTCSEDADELVSDPADAGTVMGEDFVAFIRAQCAVWPRGQRPADFREPARGTTPVLLLSGQYDPVTPPRYGDTVAASLSNARHLVLNGQGHNVLGVGCAPKLLARFIETADPAEPDAACLDRLRAPPPFSGHYGWEP